MKYWFTSDTHFGHANIIEYCNRPFKDVDDMENKIVKNWNKVVKPEDVVFHLGDFIFRGKPSEIKKKLNGKIILIKGNHDSHNDSIIDEIAIYHGGMDWVLIHDPALTTFTNVICGHVHEAWKVKKIKDRVMINVGVDVNNYTPVNIEQILKAIQDYKGERNGTKKV